MPTNKINFADAFASYPALEIRRSELNKALKKLCRREGGAQLDMATLQILVDDETTAPSLRVHIDDFCEAIGSRPYSGPEVLKLLKITNRERVRWTKDERLVRGGGQIIDRGQRIAVVTYATEFIDRLAQMPEQVAAWRAQDEEASRARTREG